jgi:hypothetical protein
VAVPEAGPARWLAEVPVEEQGALLVERYHPTALTILYGAGGVGKGLLACHDTIRLTRDGDHVVLIIDYEHHPEEWVPRIRNLGGGDAMVDRIAYWEPPVGPIWEHIDQIKAQVDAVGATFVWVDSVVFACAGSDTSGGDPTAPILFQAAVAQLGVPVAALAHVTKDTKNFAYPFGSVFWHNAARLTYSYEEVGDGRVLRHRKSNNYAKRPAMKITAVFADAEWHSGPLVVTALEEVPFSQKIAGLLEDQMVEPYEPKTAKALLALINANVEVDAGETLYELDAVRQALNRGKKMDPPRFRHAGGTTAEPMWARAEGQTRGG